ncbi:hypothetical protein [Synechococcus sp. CS-1328]|uniref:hypothetical protein n=1 Tax=Synechococcus sp. CS-1328 TaxID=2847976 RepID=UPI00223A780A|nr:hypothetical protein [Synechococcus sp. CS-1328]MCT0226003.1 hypothetical protein [Synechococcus sp. CS-1328]
MNRSLSILVCLGLIVSAPAAVLAQQKPASSAVNDAQLRQQFRDGFLRGCLGNNLAGIRNKTQYCTCLADAYNSRYDGATLAAISQFATTAGNAGTTLVNLMMQPETQRCKAANS